MNNSNADQALKNCDAELRRIENYINTLGSTNPISGCLTQYALIRISATLEVCYKTIIADFYESLSPHFSRFIFHHVRDANMNATFDNICTMLSRFDETKKNSFKTQVHRMANKDVILQTFSEINVSTR